MSRRTAEASKAILVAWRKEKELVQEGKGTREWTSQQQQDIMDKGKAYDKDGVSFQGQHMKSAEVYPDYQGVAENIQFLTKAEHLEAHDGNWRNPTNWYFNPITKEKTDFGDGKFIPCEIIQLAEPIGNIQIEKDIKKEFIQEPVNAPLPKAEQNIGSETPRTTPPPQYTNMIDKQPTNFGQNLKSGLKTLGKIITAFPVKHPTVMKVIYGAGIVATVAVATTAAVVKSVKKSSSDSGYGQSDTNDDYDYDDYSTDDDSVKSSEHSSLAEQMVPDHKQRYHYKDGSVKWKDKEPYLRGGKKDE